MSKFSGKCDLYDWFAEIANNGHETPYECYKRLDSDIFMHISGEDKPITIHKPSDLVMFYPFTFAAHAHSENVDAIFLPYHSHLVEVVSYHPDGAAHYMDELLKEYWRVKHGEDPKYTE